MLRATLPRTNLNEPLPSSVMAIMIGEIQCNNPTCKTMIEFHQEGIQYGNLKYEVTCPRCGQTMQFAGVGTVRFRGDDISGFVSAKEVV